ncbi:MAG: Rid family hydrolase, partial [Longimicrobiales bacterium]
MELIQPDGWPRGIGYAHAVAATGRIISISGQIGWDATTRTLVAPDLAGQAARALANIVTV